MLIVIRTRKDYASIIKSIEMLLENRQQVYYTQNAEAILCERNTVNGNDNKRQQ